MNYETSSGNPGSSSQVDFHLQEKLHRLLERLDWSYVAHWSFNRQSRKLEWTGGHFKGNSSAHSNAEVWNRPLFDMQRTCTFTPSRGSVGQAFAEGRNIWVNGPSVHLNAGSDVQAKILEHARIETAVYIPSAGTVLELGTWRSMAEDTHLMNSIYEIMWGPILPALGHPQAPPHVSQQPLAPLLSHESHGFLNHGFQLSVEQKRRAPGLNISDMFSQQQNEDEELGITSSVPTEPTWVPSPSTLRPPDLFQSPNSQTLPVSSGIQQVLISFYRSQSGTTSSSLSSLEDTSFKLSEDSPDQNISHMAPSTSQRHDSQNYASSSAGRRETATPSPELQFMDTTGIPVPTHPLQEPFGRLLGAPEAEPWTQTVYNNPHLEPLRIVNVPDSLGFSSWRHTHFLPRPRERSANQGLLRRSFEILRQIRNLQQHNLRAQGPEAPLRNRERPRRGPPSSSPEDVPAHEQAEPPRGRRPSRPRGPGYDDAAKQHMLSERERRQKQKANFRDLRSLVPIISKNDKASILSDAIIYIKQLEERNKQLEALVAATSSGGASSSTLPPPP